MDHPVFKRVLCVLLVWVLILGNLPVTALAQEVFEEDETLLEEAVETIPPETIPETTEQTLPEATEETIPETTAETIPETEETLLAEQAPAVDTDDGEELLTGEIPFQLNPLYEGIVDPAEYENWEPECYPISFYAAYGTPADVTAQIRAYMIGRIDSFTVYFTDSVLYDGANVKAMLMDAMAHTGNPVEGDYLKWQYAGYRARWSYDVSNGKYYYAITYEIPYYTTLDEEEWLEEAIATLLTELDLSAKSDYEKIRAVYDYICQNVTYDYANLNDADYNLKFTAYAALHDKTAVCQGYAVLLYRLALELGIDCRFISGIGNGGHGWNIVKLGQFYYNADSTWDAPRAQKKLAYQYFLKSSGDFGNHTRDDEYDTPEFHAAYPTSTTNYSPDAVAVPEQGSCGESVRYTLADGTLTITGSGAMADYSDAAPAPWQDCPTKITTVVVESGVTTIGSRAFYGCTDLTDVAIPDSVTSIGSYAFFDCTSLKKAALSDTVTMIGDDAFGFCGEGILVDGFQLTASRASEAYFYAQENGIVLNAQGIYAPDYSDEGIAGEELTVYARENDTASAVRGTVKSGETVYPYRISTLSGGSRWGLLMGMRDGTSDPVWGNYTAEQLSDTEKEPVRGWVCLDTLTRPKTTAMAITLNGTALEGTLDVDMYPSGKLDLGVQVTPVDARQTAVWSSSATAVAKVDSETGAVTLHKPGTVTITAAATDDSGVSAQVTLIVYHVDKARTLKASLAAPYDISEGGLQPGQTLTMTVAGENPIDASKLDFSPQEGGIANVDQQGVITAGTKSGTVTVTAALKGDPLKRKVSVKIPVIAMRAETLELILPENVQTEDSTLILEKSAGARSFVIAAVAKDWKNEPLTRDVKWISVDTSVAKITTAKDGTTTLTIPGGVSGECVITAVVNDPNKAQSQLRVSVRDYTPRLESTKLALNCYSQTGVSLGLRASYDNYIQEVTLNEYDRVSGSYQPSSRFTVDADGTVQALKPLANGTYSQWLDVRCQNRVTYRYSMQIRVANSLPSVTVKQTEKFNLFYLDSTAHLSITAPGQTIADVNLKSDHFALTWEDGTATLRYADAYTPGTKANTRATLEVWLEGYSTPVSKTITISTLTTAPKLSLDPASSTINTALSQDRTAVLRVWNSASKDYVNLPEAEVTCTASFAEAQIEGDQLNLILKKGSTGGTAAIYVREPGWAQSVKLTHRVTDSAKPPVLKLGATTLKLSRYFTEQTA